MLIWRDFAGNFGDFFLFTTKLDFGLGDIGHVGYVPQKSTWLTLRILSVWAASVPGVSQWTRREKSKIQNSFPKFQFRLREIDPGSCIANRGLLLIDVGKPQCFFLEFGRSDVMRW